MFPASKHSGNLSEWVNFTEWNVNNDSCNIFVFYLAQGFLFSFVCFCFFCQGKKYRHRGCLRRRQSARPLASAGNFLCCSFIQNKFWLPGALRWAEGQGVGWSNPHFFQRAPLPAPRDPYFVLSKWLVSTSAACLQDSKCSANSLSFTTDRSSLDNLFTLFMSKLPRPLVQTTA